MIMLIVRVDIVSIIGWVFIIFERLSNWFSYLVYKFRKNNWLDFFYFN